MHQRCEDIYQLHAKGDDQWPCWLRLRNGGASRTSISIFNQFLNIKIYFMLMPRSEVHVLHLCTRHPFAGGLYTRFTCWCKCASLVNGVAVQASHTPDTTDNVGKTKVCRCFHSGGKFFFVLFLLFFFILHVKIQYVTMRQTTKIALRTKARRARRLSCQTPLNIIIYSAITKYAIFWGFVVSSVWQAFRYALRR